MRWGVSVHSVDAWSVSTYNEYPRPKVAFKLSRILGCTLDDIYRDADEDSQ